MAAKAKAKLPANPAGLKGEARKGWLEAMMSGAALIIRAEKRPVHNHDLCRALGVSLDAQGAGALYSAMKADARFEHAPRPKPEAEPMKACFGLSAKGKREAAKLAKAQG